MTQFSLSSFVAGLILGLLLAGAWFFRDGSVFMSPASSAPPSAGAHPPVGGSGAISVIDQPAGNVVVVESVTVPPPGVWVAVRETNGSDLGNVLGAARVGGPRTNVTVSLLRMTEPNRSYAVELYRDDGSNTFDPSSNSVYVDFDSGERVVAYFTTSE